MIPLSVPHLAGNEWQYVKDCLDTGWVSSAGSYVTRFEEMVAAFSGSPYGVACMNGTAALHLSLQLVGVQAGDYVLLPNLTFVASANAIAYTGARPLLVDVDPHTWQLDLDLLEAYLMQATVINERNELLHKSDGRRIAALMPVHVLGNMCDMERLQFIAQRFQLPVVEDTTEALGSYFRGQHAGSFGTLGCFSFNGNKIITTGGGGVIVSADADLAQRAKHLTTQAKIQPDEYFHDEVGYNYRLVNVLAAIGVAQMEQLPEFLRRKQEIDARYRSELSGVGDITLQQVTEGVQPNCWLFTLRTQQMRQLLARLTERGIMARPFWVPMNQLPMFAQDRYVQRHDYARQVYETSLSIPSSANLTEVEQGEVIKVIREFYGL